MNKKKNKLGICAWNLPFQGKELFEFARTAGLSGISLEFDYETGYSAAQAEAWCREKSALAKEYEIELPILGLNMLGIYGMSKEEHFSEAKRILELGIPAAAEVGSIGVHLPSFGAGAINSDAELEQTLRCLEYAVKLGEQHQIQIGLESVLPEEMYVRILKEIASPVFYLLYDNENLLRDGQDPAQAYLKHSKVYRHAHIKNSNAKSGMPEPLCENKDYGGIGAVLDTMSDQGFSGWILLETDYKKLKNKKEMQNMAEEDVKFLLGYF